MDTVAGRFAASLMGEEEVLISFVKRNGKKRTIPVWFVVEGDQVEFLPMYGLKTKWFMDVEAKGKLEVRSRKQVKSAVPRVVKDPQVVDRIKERFGVKYGESDVRKYYPTSEVALVVRV